MLFKNQYYYFVSGLPDFSFDSTKLPFSVKTFREMLNETLKPEDKMLVARYFLRYDNHNLFHYLKKSDAAWHPAGNFTHEEIAELVNKVKSDDPMEHELAPGYFASVIRQWLSAEGIIQARTLEDLISSFYMDYGLDAKNSLIARWFELNLNIGNILSAIYARKYDIDIPQVVAGSNAIATTIRENPNARNFGIGLELEWFDTLQRLSEEDDLYERERKLDKFRWNWLEEQTTLDYFNIEYLFAYLCKLEILERWVSLNAEEGERIFRELIQDLKSGINQPEDI